MVKKDFGIQALILTPTRELAEQIAGALRNFSKYERKKIIEDAGYNTFLIHADDVLIDLLTDSGTSAMSSDQWTGIMRGDESYAGAKSFYTFEAAVKKVTGDKFIIPTHQGRASEKILFSIVGGKGKYFPNNTHFDTTRANAEATGAIAIDLPAPGALDFDKSSNFKGDMDLNLLEKYLKENDPGQIAMVILKAFIAYVSNVSE